MWVKAYAEDGFVIVPNLQGADTLDRLRQAMDRIMKDPKGVPEDLRHKVLYERTHVAKYREWHNGIITGTPCVRSRICRYRAKNSSTTTPESAPVKSVSLR